MNLTSLRSFVYLKLLEIIKALYVDLLCFLVMILFIGIAITGNLNISVLTDNQSTEHLKVVILPRLRKLYASVNDV